MCQVGSPYSKEHSNQLLESIAKTEGGADSFAYQFGQKLSAVPAKPILEWDIPFLKAAELRDTWQSDNHWWTMTGYAACSYNEFLT